MLLSGAFALLGTLLGAWLTRRSQRDVLTFEANLRRAAKLEESVGDTKAIIVDDEPTRIVMSSNPDGSLELMRLLGERWSVVRTSLVGSSLLHDREEVRDAVAGLSVDVGNLLTAAGWLVQDMSTTSKLTRSQLQEAATAYEQATERLEGLIELLRS